MVNIIGMGVFGLLFLIFLAVISNASPTAIANIQTQFNKISCPLPAGSGLWNNTATNTIIYKNGTYNYKAVNNNVLTLTCSQVHTLDGVDYYFGQPTIALGVFFYALDYVSELLVNKGGAILTIIGFILTPANFTILGFTINDLTGMALMAVIGVYAICYIFIGAMMYRLINPFGGVG